MDHTNTLPLDVAWQTVDAIGPLIWWSKAIAGWLIATCIALLPQPTVRSITNPHGMSRLMWLLVMYSRAGIIIGGLLLLLSKITVINAFGPLGDFAFYPAMATNLLCLVWCRRKTVLAKWRFKATPEWVVMRALIAGKPGRRS